MGADASTTAARELMLSFADWTGLTTATSPKRYLWTDAFAVCNFLELERRTGEPRFRQLALQLVTQVHRVLGRHRSDDSRRGWISGLGEAEGEEHPTAGGLRIGKPMNERQRDETFDEREEWERDGQYFHYLTKWMLALYRVGQTTSDAKFYRWAGELARATHSRFVYHPSAGDEQRLRWKMSIDLTYPLVASQGQHDPLDGWITFQQLQVRLVEAGLQSLSLSHEIDQLGRMCKGKSWTTDDPLGIGGLLIDAYRVARLTVDHVFVDPPVLQQLLHSANIGLEYYHQAQSLKRPATHRLAFRELGLSIGLHAVERLQEVVGLESHVDVEKDLQGLTRFVPMAETVESYWLQPQHRQSQTWEAHREINTVMLATSLIPDGYLQV